MAELRSKVKSNLKALWSNLRFEVTLPSTTNFSRSPIWLLGECYHPESSVDRQDDDDQCSWPHYRNFVADFETRTWLTYRRCFPKLHLSDLTSDCGWGCMLRTGQMLLAEALLFHFFGRRWRVRQRTETEKPLYLELLRWFADIPGESAPFSVHSLVRISAERGCSAGQWYGPAQVAHLLKDAVETSYHLASKLTELVAYVAQDCTVYKGDVKDLIEGQKKSTDCVECSILFIVPIRLGGESLNKIYFPCIKALLSLDWCVGIMGGRPKHSLFFMGWQDDRLIYLDPHYCQDAVDMTEDSFSISTFHCLQPRRVAMTRMDPSCAVGFYCKNWDEFDVCTKKIEEVIAPPQQRGSYPFFTFHEGRSKDVIGGCTPPTRKQSSGKQASGHSSAPRLSVFPVQIPRREGLDPSLLSAKDRDDSTFLVVDKSDSYKGEGEHEDVW